MPKEPIGFRVSERRYSKRHLRRWKESDQAFLSLPRSACFPQGGRRRLTARTEIRGVKQVQKNWPVSRHGAPQDYLFMVERSSAVCSSGRSLSSSLASAKVNHWRVRFSRSGQSASSLVTVAS